MRRSFPTQSKRRRRDASTRSPRQRRRRRLTRRRRLARRRRWPRWRRNARTPRLRRRRRPPRWNARWRRLRRRGSYCRCTAPGESLESPTSRRSSRTSADTFACTQRESGSCAHVPKVYHPGRTFRITSASCTRRGGGSSVRTPSRRGSPTRSSRIFSTSRWRDPRRTPPVTTCCSWRRRTGARSRLGSRTRARPTARRWASRWRTRRIKIWTKIWVKIIWTKPPTRRGRSCPSRSTRRGTCRTERNCAGTTAASPSPRRSTGPPYACARRRRAKAPFWTTPGHPRSPR
mmetsp:Transcript_2583/g.10488  ORF Transcript_2583/g.10488 Transcript_2583/m.10488 type:complete len:289 (-) Transcript_2583:891-1757(-)